MKYVVTITIKKKFVYR